jgi:Tol biopolymer transport system component
MLIDSVSGREKVFARGRRLSGVVSPSFSPDSRQIVYGRYDQTGGDLYVYNAASDKTKQITRDHKDFDPSWGPRWIAFNRSGSIRGGDVWLVRPDGTGTHRLTHTNAGIYPAAWSANGRRLLAANPATHNGRLWAVEVSSGRAHDLTGWVGDLFPLVPRVGWLENSCSGQVFREPQPTVKGSEARCGV